MDRDALLGEVKDYAERLTAAGDMAAFEEVFGSDDLNFDIDSLSTEELQYIYDEYISDD